MLVSRCEINPVNRRESDNFTIAYRMMKGVDLCITTFISARKESKLLQSYSDWIFTLDFADISLNQSEFILYLDD